MRIRTAASVGILAGMLAWTAAATLRAQAPPVAPSSPPAVSPSGPSARAPVYVVLQATVDDDINVPASMERLARALKTVETLQSRAAAFHPTCLVQFNGIVADRLGAENYSTRTVDTIKDYVRRGLVEIGYDGTEEPTFLARPRPNLRGADTPEKRWLARLQAHEWFLAEGKDPLTGEPDPKRVGGMKAVRDVFGRVDFARGVTFEPWYAAELVHALDALGARPALPGFLENTVYPARNFDGYRGGAPGISAMLAPDDRCAPEVFYLDNTMRLSDYGVLGGRVFNAYEGPEALAKLLEGLDRSKLHVVQIRLGHPAVYSKPGFGARNYQTPLEHAYDNPKLPKLPPAAARSDEERASMYAREDAVMDWLGGTFFPANPGSRFVSVRQLVSQAAAGDTAVVSRDELRDAAMQVIEGTSAALANLPPFLHSGHRYFSLAETFGLLAQALAEAPAAGGKPLSTPPMRLLGPLAVDDGAQTSGVRVPAAAIAGACADLRRTMSAPGWTPIPAGAVPSWVTVGGVRVTAAQFLLAMAELYVAPAGTADVEIKAVAGTTLIGAMLPMTRPRTDGGGHWTLKPAPIRFPE